MMKKLLIQLIILAVLVTSFLGLQNIIIKQRAGIRMEEKILMLSDRPSVTKIASLGFDAAVADLLWIRAIQYFGGNFSSLDEPEKKEGMINLFRNMVGLDPHFIGAYKFAGFVINESIHDPGLAMEFLLEGAENNPESWRLTFDAGFIAFHQLQDYEVAKQLFLEAVYGKNFAPEATASAEGILDGYEASTVIDGDTYSDIQLAGDNSSVAIHFDSLRNIGRLMIHPRSNTVQEFRIAYTDADEPTAFSTIDTVTATIVAQRTLQNPIEAKHIQIDNFEKEDGADVYSLAEIQVFGPPNPDAPSYVERMAIEMDRAAGRFRAAWDQYIRYLQEAQEIGDEVSFELALNKLNSIYSEKAIEILEEAVNLYKEEKGELPSAQMTDLIPAGTLQKVIDQKVEEDPQFAQEVLQVLLAPDNNLWRILTTFDGQYPFLLIDYEDDDGETDWFIISKQELIKQQERMVQRWQRYVDQYKEETGNLPSSLEEVMEEPWFADADTLLKDPLGGEFYIDQETGEVKARNPKY